MSSPSGGPMAIPFPLPYSLEWIFSPEVIYQAQGNFSAIHHCTSYDDPEGCRPVRITFEGLDSIRVCRGEATPYPFANENDTPRGDIVFTVMDSPWLRERYEYEAEHYRDAYEWGGDVEEMLTEYHHYHFAFHDEFVDVIARGIWCELTDDRLNEWPLPASHPLSGLSMNCPVLDTRSFEGESRTLRGSARTIEELERDSRYCSQPLYAIGTADDVGYQVVLRNPRGAVKTCFLDTWGTVRVEHSGVASIEEAWSMYGAFLKRQG